MNNATFVDNLLINWGERWDWSPQGGTTKKAKTSSSGLLKAILSRPRPPMTAAQARANLQAFVRKTPQVLVKISGGGKGMRQIMVHLNYISRNGELEAVEDETGAPVKGKEDLAEVRRNWAEVGSPVPEIGTQREAINIVLSMPEGTDSQSVLRAAREFAQKEFGDNHQYVLALHTFASDPGKKPSRHPHVHLAVKSRGNNGKRLNPRKADLMNWREGFAEALRENGIDATATRRRGRLIRPKGLPLAIQQITKRGEIPRHAQTAETQPVAARRGRDNAAQAIKDFEAIAKALASSTSEDQKLALALVARLQEIQAENQMRAKAKASKVKSSPKLKDRDLGAAPTR